MTDITTSRSPSGDQESTTQVARQEAANVGHSAAESGGQMVRTATEQGRQVAGEAGDRARELYGAARDEVRSQAGQQQRRAAGGLRSVGDELRAMADQSGRSGPATELARRASGSIDQLAGWLENREPGAVLEEVKRYARRHPGAYLAGAALLGVLAGRMTRGLAADGGVGTSSGDASSGNTSGVPASAAPGLASSDPRSAAARTERASHPGHPASEASPAGTAPGLYTSAAAPGAPVPPVDPVPPEAPVTPADPATYRGGRQ